MDILIDNNDKIVSDINNEDFEIQIKNTHVCVDNCLENDE